MGKECQTWGHMPLILALDRQEDQESKTSLDLPPKEKKIRLRVWFTDAQLVRAWLCCSALHECRTAVRSVCLQSQRSGGRSTPRKVGQG